MTLTLIDLKEIESLIDEKTKNLPTKDEFFGQMSEVMRELAKIRESQEVITYKVYEDHDKRIEKIEKKVGIQTL